MADFLFYAPNQAENDTIPPLLSMTLRHSGTYRMAHVGDPIRGWIVINHAEKLIRSKTSHWKTEVVADISKQEPEPEQLYQVWIGHPTYGEGPGLSREDASNLYTAQGLDSSYGAMRAGQAHVIYRVGNERWRGDGTRGMAGQGRSKYVELVADWVEASKNVEEIHGKTLEAMSHDIPDGRYRREAMLTFRLGQNFFRNKLLRLYNRRCWISGCGIERVLQAAHIEPHSGSNNQLRNGMLLRADIHNLFDAGLLWVEPLDNGMYCVRIAPGVRDDAAYKAYHEIEIDPPGADESEFPDKKRLEDCRPAWSRGD